MTKVSKARKRRPAKSLSPEERERRRLERNGSVRQLLYTREQTGAALGGVSVSTVIRLENEGKLRKVRLRGLTGQVFNPAVDVEALAEAVEVVDASKVGA